MVQLLGEQRQFSYGEVSVSFVGLVESPARTGGVGSLRNATITAGGSIKSRGGTKLLQILPDVTVLGMIDFDNQVVIITPAAVIFYLIDDIGVREVTPRIRHNGVLSHLDSENIPIQRIGRALFIQGQDGLYRLSYLRARTPRGLDGRENLGQWMLENVTPGVTRPLVDFFMEIEVRFDISKSISIDGNTFVTEITFRPTKAEDLSLSLRGRKINAPGIVGSFSVSKTDNRLAIRNDTGEFNDVRSGPFTVNTRFSGEIGPARFLFADEGDLGAVYGYTGPLRAVTGQDYLYATGGGLFTSRMENSTAEYTRSVGDSSPGGTITRGVIKFVRFLTESLFIVEVTQRLVRRNNAVDLPLDNTVEQAAAMLTAELGANWLMARAFADLNMNEHITFFLITVRVPDWETANNNYPNWAQIIGFHQNRLFFARSENSSENRIWFSGIGDYMTFMREERDANDSDAFQLALDPSEKISWALSVNTLFIGTNKSIYQIQHTEAGFALDNVTVRNISSVACKFANALPIGSQTFFIGNEDFAIYALFFSREVNSYITRNITAHIQHLAQSLEVEALGRHVNNILAITKYRGTDVPGPLLYGTISIETSALGWSVWEYPLVSNTVWGGYLSVIFSENRLIMLKRYNTRLVLEEYDENRFLDLETEATISRVTTTYDSNLYSTLELDNYPYSYLGVNGDNSYNIKGRINTALTEQDYTNLGVPMAGDKSVILGLPINFYCITLEPLVNLGGIYSGGTVVIYSYVRVLVENTEKLRLGQTAEDGKTLYHQDNSGYFYYENAITANTLGQIRIDLISITDETVPYLGCQISSIYYKFTSEDA